MLSKYTPRFFAFLSRNILIFNSKSEGFCLYNRLTHPVSGYAETALDDLEGKWGEKYPKVIASWRNKWPSLSAFFKYPEEIRKPIYTTNAVEAVHRQFRKLTKTKGAFPNENSLLKLLYLGINKASEKWTMPIQNWGQTLTQLMIYFEGRIEAIVKP